MPAEQERNVSDHFSSAWHGALREAPIVDDCPIQYEELSEGGRRELETLINAIAATEGAQIDPDAHRAFLEHKDVEYL